MLGQQHLRYGVLDEARHPHIITAVVQVQSLPLLLLGFMAATTFKPLQPGKRQRQLQSLLLALIGCLVRLASQEIHAAPHPTKSTATETTTAKTTSPTTAAMTTMSKMILSKHPSRPLQAWPSILLVKHPSRHRRRHRLYLIQTHRRIAAPVSTQVICDTAVRLTSLLDETESDVKGTP